MQHLINFIAFVGLLLPVNVRALDVPENYKIDNAELKALYESDQSERQELFRAGFRSGKVLNIELEQAAKKVWSADLIRSGKVKQLLKLGHIRTAADYWHAAFIMQHGENIEDIKLAFSFATIAIELEPEAKKYKWISAASWDRILNMRNQPQWYGTQYIPDLKTGLKVQAKIAEGAVKDEERELYGVPTLKESEEMLKQINSEVTH